MMDAALLEKMKGDWVGIGTMTVGTHVGDVVEYLKIEPTDFPTCLSYVRKSRITFPGRVVTHNELGYFRTTDVALLLSRGSYVILPWSEPDAAYVQAVGSPDSRNMHRKVNFAATGEMTWDNSMEVNQQGQWVTHTVKAVFSTIC